MQQMSFNYIKYLSVNLFLIGLLLCGNISCRVRQNDDIVAVINSIAKGSVTNSTKGIFLVRDNGCLNCSKQLVNFIGNLSQHSDRITIIAADPDKVDLSPVLNSSCCFMDSDKKLDKHHLLPNSAFISTNSGKVLHITELTARNLDSFMMYFACKN